MKKAENQDGKGKKLVVILKSSHRVRSNSSSLADELARGVQAAGGEVKSFSLSTMDIRPCRGCDGCKKPAAKGCVIHDDMQLIYPFLNKASAIVLATPIYWFTFSAQLKLAIDRFYALESPQGHGLKGKPMALIVVYGDDDLHTSGAMNAIHAFEDMCRYTASPMAGVLYGSASEKGEMETNTELLAQARALGQKLVGS